MTSAQFQTKLSYKKTILDYLGILLKNKTKQKTVIFLLFIMEKSKSYKNREMSLSIMHVPKTQLK